MKLITLNPKRALNKAFLKVKPNRSEIEVFKAQLITLLDHTNDTESEEFHKNLVSDFLKNTYYAPHHFINTKGRNDLVIHNGETANSPVGVIIETKKPTNKAEMLKQDKFNVKAFHELVLYYLRERFTLKNLEITHLIATNIYEWFIFDANIFERVFAQNKRLVKQFHNFEAGRLAGTTTDFFYKEIAEPAIAEIATEISLTYFDLREYESPLRNDNSQDDNQLIALFKLLSPEHLLKLPFSNDSNTLDKAFYTELLHIIGLTETKIGNKRLIERKPEGQRYPGSLLENVIIQLDALDKIRRLDHSGQFGETYQERLFTVGLDLVITWINRILFLKLLEAQLLSYHNSNSSYAFLKLARIKDFDDLNSLFFQVLARKPQERMTDIKQAFANIPYLNSSLFEPTELEHQTVFISNLKDDKTLPLHPSTVLKDEHGKKRIGALNTLEYFFTFLDAYDFASEGSEEIQEENKSLINASVLGLIFEKINGYKDGSFFTPGFITMYMCRETLHRAVVQKFNEQKQWICKNLDDVYDNIEDRKEANDIINNLKICDPAVGSGHFLVSALNEIIAIKSDLRILQDYEGRRLKEYHVEVVNDELIVTDEDGELFEYKPANKESQRVQEALFHEKQAVIENCLFGVDINPNSVKICRLRLWIELLKNAYYNTEGELETLPNIDINIKCGNSLISRFALDADLKQALKKNQWNITTYRNAVHTYRETESKDEKRNMEQLIADIKNNFRTEIGNNDPKMKRLSRFEGELFTLRNQQVLFDETEKEKKAKQRKQEKLEADIQKLNAEIEEIKHNKIYENAFEWRFEFPEALNDAGDFVGFDVVIGNPPYLIVKKENTIESELDYYKQYASADFKVNLFALFQELALIISDNLGITGLIIPDTSLNLPAFSKMRSVILERSCLYNVSLFDEEVFEEATVGASALIFTSKKNDARSLAYYRFIENFRILNSNTIDAEHLTQDNWSYMFNNDRVVVDLFNRITFDSGHLGTYCDIFDGINPGSKQIKAHFFNKEYEADYSKKVIDGKNFSAYSPIKWEGFYIHYSPKKVDAFRKQLKLVNKSFTARIIKTTNFFETPKIVTRQTANRIIATIDHDFYYVKNSIHSTLIKKEYANLITLEYILSILNSTLIDWYYRVLSMEAGRVFPQVKISRLAGLPIRLLSIEEQAPFIRLANQLLNCKKDTPNADTTAIEREIDRLIYELYDLSEEDIQLIEASK